MDNCVGCSGVLTKGTRRRLSTPASLHVRSILLEVLHAIIPINRRLDVGNLECFVCVPCFRSLEKILKLRKDLDKAFQGAYDKAKHSLPYLPLVAIPSIEGDKESQLPQQMQQPQPVLPLMPLAQPEPQLLSPTEAVSEPLLQPVPIVPRQLPMLQPANCNRHHCCNLHLI